MLTENQWDPDNDEDADDDDPYANAVLYGIAPGRAYVDNEQCYSCNEVTIYWNSPLIYLLDGLN